MGIIETLIITVFLGLACGYPVSIMLLNFMGGPFTKVGFQIYRHDQSPTEEDSFWDLNLFDRIRGLFPVYEKHENMWITRDNNWTSLFDCPYCLSFWFAIPFSVFITLVSGNYIWFPIYHLIIVNISVTWNKYV